jgi:hypothetical protein
MHDINRNAFREVSVNNCHVVHADGMSHGRTTINHFPSERSTDALLSSDLCMNLNSADSNNI